MTSARPSDPSDPWSGQIWVAPPLDGPPTGGTLYNRALLRALDRTGTPCRVLDVASARRALADGRGGEYWVDSLFLESLPVLRRANTAARPLRLIAHYLPSLVARAGSWTAADATVPECAALSAADAVLVPSGFLADALRSVPSAPSHVSIVEPGVDVRVGTVASEAPGRAASPGAFRAVVVANVVEGKGILPFLSALGHVASENPHLRVSIIGSIDVDSAYAAACRDAISANPSLERGVRLEGALPHEETLGRIAGSDVLISVSRMESYGMALAEARALGVPILALPGGNVAAHVSEAAGGELFGDEPSLSDALVSLSLDPGRAAARRRDARRAARARSWERAAHEFRAVVDRLRTSVPSRAV